MALFCLKSCVLCYCRRTQSWPCFVCTQVSSVSISEHTDGPVVFEAMCALCSVAGHIDRNVSYGAVLFEVMCALFL